MLARSLPILLKVRHLAVVEAKSALASALATEAAALAAECSSSNCIQDEIEAASAETADDSAVEILAAWLPQARERRDAARERRQAAEMATAKARATLAAARVAEAAVTDAIGTEEVEKRAETARQVEAILCDGVTARAVQNDN